MKARRIPLGQPSPALHRPHAQPFQVSVVPIDGSPSWPKGLECVAISLYRQEQQRSPTVNFGRMPPGYRASSSNDARLASAGKRFKGGSTTEQDASHLPGLAPVGPLEGDPCGRAWCGHAWSAWMAIRDALRIMPPEATGLYRLRVHEQEGLLSIGRDLSWRVPGDGPHLAFLLLIRSFAVADQAAARRLICSTESG